MRDKIENNKNCCAKNICNKMKTENICDKFT